MVGLVVAGATFALVEGAGDEPAPTSTQPAPATDGRAVFARMGCGGCHALAAANANGRIGPSLDQALTGYDARALREKIVNPGSNVMPADFGERMNARELGALVTFLLAAPSGDSAQ